MIKRVIIPTIIQQTYSLYISFSSNILFHLNALSNEKTITEQKKATDANIICHIQFTGQYYEYI